MSYPACATDLEVIFDWVPGTNRNSIASTAYIGSVSSGCSIHPLTNRQLIAGGGLGGDREHKVKDDSGNPLPYEPAPQPVN